MAPPSFTTEPTIVFNPNPQAPLGAIVKFTANKPVRTAIRIKDGEWERELVYDVSHNPAEGLPVVGMVPDRMHELRIFIHDDFGRLTEAAEALQFHSLGLPGDKSEFPSITMDTAKVNDQAPGIVLLNVQRRRTDAPSSGQNLGLLVAMNTKGKVVWYYRTDAGIINFKRKSNGNISYTTSQNQVREIDWLGNEQGEAMGSDEGAQTQITPLEAVDGSAFILQDSSSVYPVTWTVLGMAHLPYLIACNYCYAYPGPPRPSRRPF